MTSVPLAARAPFIRGSPSAGSTLTLRVPLTSEPTTISATSILLYLRSSIDPGDHTYRVELDDRVLTVRAHDGEVVVEPGAPAHSDGSIRTDPKTLNALLANPATLPEAVAAGHVEISGDPMPLITRTGTQR